MHTPVDFTPVLQALIALLSVLITTFLIPFIRSKTTEQQRESANNLVKIGVAAAEQLYPNSAGKFKKEEVLEFLAHRGVNLDEELIDEMIESAVYQLKHNGLGV